jgi:hypothetical protein
MWESGGDGTAGIRKCVSSFPGHLTKSSGFEEPCMDFVSQVIDEKMDCDLFTIHQNISRISCHLRFISKEDGPVLIREEETITMEAC